MSTTALPAIEIHDWAHAAPHAIPLRTQVFVREQGVPPEIELDALDSLSRHALAFGPDGQVLGTGRLLPDGHIGRMAVLPAWRGRGIGQALLNAALDRARTRGVRIARLSAQTHAAGFYRRAGFAVEGDSYAEAGIPHVAMTKRLVETHAGVPPD